MVCGSVLAGQYHEWKVPQRDWVTSPLLVHLRQLLRQIVEFAATSRVPRLLHGPEPNSLNVRRESVVGSVEGWRLGSLWSSTRRG